MKINKCKVCTSICTPYLCFHDYYEYCEYSHSSGFHGDLVELAIKFDTMSSFVTCHWISSKSNTTRDPSNASRPTELFCEVRVSQFLAFCVLHCLSFFVWSLSCMVFDLRILITPLVSKPFFFMEFFYESFSLTIFIA